MMDADLDVIRWVLARLAVVHLRAGRLVEHAHLQVVHLAYFQIVDLIGLGRYLVHRPAVNGQQNNAAPRVSSLHPCRRSDVLSKNLACLV